MNITKVNPVALTVDWVGKNLLWIDMNYGKPSIMISDMNGGAIRKLTSKTLQKPQSIVLDAIQGYVKFFY